MRIRKSFFAVPLVVLFLSFLYPQTGRADCPDDWWCPTDPPNPEVVNNPYDPWGYSPGFDLIVCYDRPCADSLGALASGLPTPHVTINTLAGPNGEIGCTTGTTVALEGPAICAASTDGVLDQNSAAACFVSIKLPNVSCTVADGLATYSKFQAAQQAPSDVFTSDSHIAIGEGRVGWPCNATGDCKFPIGTEFCSSFNGCVAKIYPTTGEGLSFLFAGQVLKGSQKDNYVALRGCKGAANGNADSITCTEQGNILTGGGEASVSVKCPQPNFAGNRETISPNSSNNGLDLFGSSECPLNGIVRSSIKVNGVPTTGCKPQGGNRIRCFFDEGAVYAASCSTSGEAIKLIATGNINVPQGTEKVTVPFFTDPGDTVTCQ